MPKDTRPSHLARDRGRKYKRIRAAVLERDGYLCQLRFAEVCTGTAEEVHHSLGHAVTGDDPSAMVASCTACNRRVGRPDVDDRKPRRTTKW